jgi:hypothetical protein
MVFSATFNKVLAISWRSALLVEKTAVPAENHRPAASHWQTWSHVVSSTSRNKMRIDICLFYMKRRKAEHIMGN